MPNRSERERRLMRAFEHYIWRDHELDAVRCHGCREACGFLTVPGYEGDTDYPTCAEALGGTAGGSGGKFSFIHS